MLEKLGILFFMSSTPRWVKSLVKSVFPLIFVTLPIVGWFERNDWAGFVNYGKKWPQYHGFSKKSARKGASGAFCGSFYTSNY